MNDPLPPAVAGDDDAASTLYWLMAGVARRLPGDRSRTAEATLGTLDRLGPTRLSKLADHERVTQPTMTALVTRLERDGLLARRSDATDGRAVLVVLTGAGQRYLRQRQRIGTDLVAGLIGQLPAEQAAALDRALPAIRSLRALVHEVPPPAGDPTRPLVESGRSPSGT